MGGKEVTSSETMGFDPLFNNSPILISAGVTNISPTQEDRQYCFATFSNNGGCFESSGEVCTIPFEITSSDETSVTMEWRDHPIVLNTLNGANGEIQNVIFRQVELGGSEARWRAMHGEVRIIKALPGKSAHLGRILHSFPIRLGPNAPRCLKASCADIFMSFHICGSRVNGTNIGMQGNY